MDKPRKNPKKKRRPFYIAGGIIVALGITLGLSQLEPAAPGVDRAILWRDTVQRGEMVRQVGGPGTLVPVDIRIVTAVTAGRIEEVHARPGTQMQPGSPIVRLSNPDEQLLLLGAERDLSNARTQLTSLRVTLETQRLAQEAQVLNVQTLYAEAERQAKLNEELLEKGVGSVNQAALTQDTRDELKERLELEKRRLEVMSDNIAEQIASQGREVERIEQIVAYRNQRIESMNVVAGTEGVLQALDLEIGQYVTEGTELARVVKPGRLKAELRIPETQAVDVTIGQTAHIDTRNGIVTGRIVRIDPAAQTGTVGVDVELPDELPAGARPDLSVDGKIEIERLDDVLFVGRPQFGSANSTISLFRVEPDGRHASRVRVQLGQSSVNEIVISQGLNEGDDVILSDMSQVDDFDRVRLK
ncbi:MAG: efflux RND transporter periplasmic adaptor subunit [Longimicrobiales bacterium]